MVSASGGGLMARLFLLVFSVVVLVGFCGCGFGFFCVGCGVCCWAGVVLSSKWRMSCWLFSRCWFGVFFWIGLVAAVMDWLFLVCGSFVVMLITLGELRMSSFCLCVVVVGVFDFEMNDRISFCCGFVFVVDCVFVVVLSGILGCVLRSVCS